MQGEMKFHFATDIRSDTPESHVEYIKERARQDADAKVIEQIRAAKSPVVVSVEERLESSNIHDCFFSDRFEIIISITPVKYKDVTIENVSYKDIAMTLWEHLKAIFKKGA